MEIAELTARLVADVAQFNTNMESADATIAAAREAVAGLERNLAELKGALDSVGGGHLEEVSAALGVVDEEVKKVRDDALEAAAALKEVQVSDDASPRVRLLREQTRLLQLQFEEAKAAAQGVAPGSEAEAKLAKMEADVNVLIARYIAAAEAAKKTTPSDLAAARLVALQRQVELVTLQYEKAALAAHDVAPSEVEQAKIDILGARVAVLTERLDEAVVAARNINVDSAALARTELLGREYNDIRNTLIELRALQVGAGVSDAEIAKTDIQLAKVTAERDRLIEAAAAAEGIDISELAIAKMAALREQAEGARDAMIGFDIAAHEAELNRLNANDLFRAQSTAFGEPLRTESGAIPLSSGDRATVIGGEEEFLRQRQQLLDEQRTAGGGLAMGPAEGRVTDDIQTIRDLQEARRAYEAAKLDAMRGANGAVQLGVGDRVETGPTSDAVLKAQALAATYDQIRNKLLEIQVVQRDAGVSDEQLAKTGVLVAEASDLRDKWAEAAAASKEMGPTDTQIAKAALYAEEVKKARDAAIGADIAGAGGGGRGGLVGQLERDATGGGGNNNGGAASGLLGGILPGGRRAGVGAVLTLAGIGLSLGPTVAPAAAGAAAGASAGLSSLIGAAATLKLAFADITKAAFTTQKAFDALTTTQQNFVQQIRAIDFGFVRPLENVAATSTLPGLTAAAKEAITPSSRLVAGLGVQGFGQGISAGTQDLAKLIGSADFAKQLGPVFQADAKYIADFFQGVTHLADAFVRLENAAIPLVNWMDRGVLAFTNYLDVSIKSAQASGVLAGYFDKAKTSLQALGGLVHSLGNVFGALFGAVGFQNALGVLETFKQLFGGLAALINQNKTFLRDFFQGALGAAQDAIRFIGTLTSAIAPLLSAIDKVVKAFGGWRAAFDITLLGVFTAKAIALGEALIGVSAAAKVAETAEVTLGGTTLALSTATGAAATKATGLIGALTALGGTVQKGAAALAGFAGASTAATAVTALGAASATAAPEVGLLEGALLSIVAIPAAVLGGIAVAVIAIAGGLAYLLTMESDAQRATDRLSQSLGDLAKARKAIPYDKLSADEAHLAYEQAVAALATTQAARGSVAYKVAADQVTTALQTWRDAQAKLNGDLATHQKDLNAAKTAILAIKTSLDQPAQSQHGGGWLGQVVAALSPAQGDPLQKWLNTLQGLAVKYQALDPLTSHNIELVKQLGQAIGHVPSQHDIKLLLDNNNIGAQLIDYINQLPDVSASALQNAGVVMGGTLGAAIIAGLQGTVGTQIPAVVTVPPGATAGPYTQGLQSITQAQLTLPASIQKQLATGDIGQATAAAYAYYQKLLRTPGISAADKQAILAAEAPYAPPGTPGPLTGTGKSGQLPIGLQAAIDKAAGDAAAGGSTAPEIAAIQKGIDYVNAQIPKTKDKSVQDTLYQERTSLYSQLASVEKGKPPPTGVAVLPPALQASLTNAESAASATGGPQTGVFNKADLDAQRALHAQDEAALKSISEQISKQRAGSAALRALEAERLTLTRERAAAEKAITEELKNQRQAAADIKIARIFHVNPDGSQIAAGPQGLLRRERQILLADAKRYHVETPAMITEPLSALIKQLTREGAIPKSSLRALQEINAAIEVSIKSGTKLSSTWSALISSKLTQINDTLKLTLHPSNYRVESADKLAKSIPGLTPAERVAVEARYAQALAHGGRIPGGPAYAGVPTNVIPPGAGRAAGAGAGTTAVPHQSLAQNERELRQLRAELSHTGAHRLTGEQARAARAREAVLQGQVQTQQADQRELRRLTAELSHSGGHRLSAEQVRADRARIAVLTKAIAATGPAATTVTGRRHARPDALLTPLGKSTDAITKNTAAVIGLTDTLSKGGGRHPARHPAARTAAHPPTRTTRTAATTPAGPHLTPAEKRALTQAITARGPDVDRIHRGPLTAAQKRAVQGGATYATPVHPPHLTAAQRARLTQAIGARGADVDPVRRAQLTPAQKRGLQSAVGGVRHEYVLPGRNPGLLERGNLDLLHRKVAHLANGMIATVHDISIGITRGKKQLEVLIPEVINGKLVGEAAAKAHFFKTGENLGSFSSVKAANEYAQRLHLQQAKYYGKGGPGYEPPPRHTQGAGGGTVIHKIEIHVDGSKEPETTAREIQSMLLKISRRNPVQTRGPNAGHKLGL